MFRRSIKEELIQQLWSLNTILELKEDNILKKWGLHLRAHEKKPKLKEAFY